MMVKAPSVVNAITVTLLGVPEMASFLRQAFEANLRTQKQSVVALRACGFRLEATHPVTTNPASWFSSGPLLPGFFLMSHSLLPRSLVQALTSW